MTTTVLRAAAVVTENVRVPASTKESTPKGALHRRRVHSTER